VRTRKRREVVVHVAIEALAEEARGARQLDLDRALQHLADDRAIDTERGVALRRERVAIRWLEPSLGEPGVASIGPERRLVALGDRVDHRALNRLEARRHAPLLASPRS
jgi:hypothetical protein